MYEAERDRIQELTERLEHLIEGLKIDAKTARLAELDAHASAPDLWNNPDAARALLQEQRVLQRVVSSCAALRQKAADAAELVALAAEERDESLSDTLGQEVSELEQAYDDFEFARTLSGPMDINNAYLTIHAGAGGTEACDWAQMLLRMYVRWCEAHAMRTTEIEHLDGEDAGVKSVTVLVSGEYAFGYLKAERGVHRLVRISPYDSSSRRHTSFASVDVTAEIDDNIEIEMDEKDLRIDTYRSSGAGGQHVNVTDSAVRITHVPTGIVVACQNERSQIKNRSTAMKLLKAKLYQLELEKREQQASAEYASKQKIEWGSQIRSYVLHPYNLVKDLRTEVETSDTNAVLDGDIDAFITAYLRATAKAN
jgi:peptide chain release factor 2